VSAVNAKSTVGHLNSLSNFESSVCFLYQSVAAKVDNPLIIGLLQGIAQDGLKHSKLLKAITESSAYSKEKAKEFSSKLAVAWSNADKAFIEKVASGTKFGSSQLDLLEKLAELESNLAEEYAAFLEEDILVLLAKETSGHYKVKPDDIRSIFLGMVKDERHHKKIMAIVIELLSQDKSESVGITPIVKYQSPDSW
jgi:hypothetical protein